MSTKTEVMIRAEGLGPAAGDDPELHIRADGMRVDPMALRNSRFAFALPPNRQDIALVSRTWRPAAQPESRSDARTLGVCIRRLDVDGDTVALDDAALDRGWHKPEGTEHNRWRWTDGAAGLPAGARIIIVDLT